MDRTTRHDLKTDKFVEEVAHSVEYVSEHRQQMVKYGGIAAAVLILAGGTWAFLNYQKTQRQRQLAEVFAINGAFVGPTPNPGIRSYATEQEKRAALEKASKVLLDAGGSSDEVIIANFIAGTKAADSGNMVEGEKYLKLVVDKGGLEYSNLARMALADLYAAQGKVADSEKILRQVLDKPSSLASKETATLSLARILKDTKPADAKKLLQPLMTSSIGAASRAAITLNSEIDAATKK